MSDDLVKRLRQIGEGAYVGAVSDDRKAAREAASRIEKLEAALRNIAEGDIPRTVKIPFRDDRQPSKLDRCEHDRWFYEDCGYCIEDYAHKALDAK